MATEHVRSQARNARAGQSRAEQGGRLWLCSCSSACPHTWVGITAYSPRLRPLVCSRSLQHNMSPPRNINGEQARHTNKDIITRGDRGHDSTGNKPPVESESSGAVVSYIHSCPNPPSGLLILYMIQRCSCGEAKRRKTPSPTAVMSTLVFFPSSSSFHTYFPAPPFAMLALLSTR